MDYDENDFQGHNLQLAGEESSKISPVLCPYALPKFDFDDSLQGHLRFDSLVENEVFLGIPSQEDNQWIEDFSRGSSGIEFSSGAAESCSISRHHNVWSEATSSESVEMLLKSVGQEDIVPGEPIIEESDDAGELGRLTKQMEPNDDKGDNFMDSQAELQPNEFLENLSRSNVTYGEGCLDIKSASQAQDAEHCTNQISTELVTDDNLDIIRKCEGQNQNEVSSSGNEVLDVKVSAVSAVLGIQSDNMDSSLLSIVEKVGELKDQNLSDPGNNICLENENISGGVEDHNALSKMNNVGDQILKGGNVELSSYNLDSPLNVASSVPIEQPTTSFTGSGEASGSQPKDGFELQITVREGVKFVSHGSESKAAVYLGGTEMSQDHRSGMHEEAPFGDDEQQDVNNTTSDSCASLVQDLDSRVKVTHEPDSYTKEKEDLFAADSRMDKVSSDKNLGASFSEGVTELSEQVDGSNINVAGELTGLTAVHSTSELPVKRTEVEDMKGSDNSSGNQTGYSDGENYITPPAFSGPLESLKDILFSEQGDVQHHEQDTSLVVKGNAELPTVSSAVKCQTIGPRDLDHKVGLDESVEENGMAVGGSEISLCTADRSGSAVEDQVIDHSEKPPSPEWVAVSMPIDKKQETEANFPCEASTLILKQSSEVVSEQVPESEVGKGASQDSATQISQEEVDQSLVETSNILNQSEQEMLHSEVDNQNTSNEMEVCLAVCHSVVKNGDGAEAVVSANHEEPMVKINEVTSSNEPVVSNQGVVQTESASLANSTVDQRDGKDNFVSAPLAEGDGNHLLEGSGSNQDSGKCNPSSPVIISLLEPSQSQKDRKEMFKDDLPESVSVSDVNDRRVDQIHSVSLNKTGTDVTKEERRFTFEVAPLKSPSDGLTGEVHQVFPFIQACKTSVVGGSPPTSGGNQIEQKIVQEVSRESPQIPKGGTARGSVKGTPERKGRQQFGKSTGKETSRKGNQSKETSSARQTEKGDKSRGVSSSLSEGGQLVLFGELKTYGNVEHGGTKPSGVISLQTPNLPDLNSSVPSALFQQPFTDIQQVQLRAQIFVYGSLIQGVAPDEACMVSAFGSSDGSRNSWDPAWRACVERVQGQKSHPRNPETPLQLRSGAKAPEVSKQGSVQNRVLSTPVIRANNKSTPSPMINNMIPLSSPLWNLSTPSDALPHSSMPRGAILDYHQPISPLHAYQIPPLRNFVSPNASWLSQASFPGHWAVSSQTSSNINSCFPTLPITEAVKLTPVKESLLPISSGTMHTSTPVFQIEGTTVLGGSASVLDKKKVTMPQHSSDTKTRKKKKVAAAEDLGLIPSLTPKDSVSASIVSTPMSKKVSIAEDIGHIALLNQTRTGPVPVPVVAASVSSHLSYPVASTSARPNTDSGELLMAMSPNSSIDHLKRGDQNTDKKVLISDQTYAEVGEARLQAEDAATHAAVAVSHCQAIWSELEKQKNAGLNSDVEAKLASAAVAISAAASVAKAAAAAAKIASNAAAIAKLMVDEALISSEAGNNAMSIYDFRSFGKATPETILKGGDGSNSSNSIIFTAREAARKRVETASAASRHADNLDAVVKAAELAAEAVSQAGKIVAMGDPLPLNELVEAGPEGYWKDSQLSSPCGVKLSNVDKALWSKNYSKNGSNASAKLSKKETLNHSNPPLHREISKDLVDDHLQVMDGGGKDLRGQRVSISSDLAKTIGVVPESEIGSRSTSINVQDEHENVAGISEVNNIMEGCVVEVFKDGNSKAAWFSASVLSLKDAKALVCYTHLQADEGSVQLKEWIPLQGEGNESPRIRIPHPLTPMRLEGTRKRRREALTDYAWSVGDRVDAWINNCWREGVIAEKSKKDETTLTVHFPVEGDSSVVSVWHVRPTLIWKEGKWLECSTLREMNVSSKGDTPHEKRLKVGSAAKEGKGKDKISQNIDVSESGNLEESRLLPLSASEKLLSFGSNVRDENRHDPVRTTRTGLQKGGSKVIFGVPKPGKKRKFMEVSKHYVGDKSNTNDAGNDSEKFAKYLVPQRSGSCGWKSSSKIDTSERQATQLKPKVLRSGKPPVVSGRTLPQKGTLLNVSVSAPNDDTVVGHINKNCMSSDDNESSQQDRMEFGSVSNSEEAASGPISLAPPPDAPKNASTSSVKYERMSKGRPSGSGGKLDKLEAREKSIPQAVGPRRSTRQIQPTSRLLEGLQSSLIISKIPAVAHDKVNKSQNRSAKGNHG